MEDSSFELVDRQGVRAQARRTAEDPSSIEVLLPSGERVFVASVLVHARDGSGTAAFDDSFEACLQRVAGGEVVLPVLEEQVQVSKRTVERDKYRLNTSVSTRDELVDLPLIEEEISVERVPINRVVQAASGPRQEGETLIVPVYEETIVVEKRLVLKEEVRVTRTRHERHAPQRIPLRREELVVERIAPSDEPG